MTAARGGTALLTSLMCACLAACAIHGRTDNDRAYSVVEVKRAFRQQHLPLTRTSEVIGHPEEARQLIILAAPDLARGSVLQITVAVLPSAADARRFRSIAEGDLNQASNAFLGRDELVWRQQNLVVQYDQNVRPSRLGRVRAALRALAKQSQR